MTRPIQRKPGVSNSGLAAISGRAMTRAAAAIRIGRGRRRNGRARTLHTAIECRMPKKIQLSGMAKYVATLTIAAHRTITPRRRPNRGQLIPDRVASTRLTPTSARKDPAIRVRAVSQNQWVSSGRSASPRNTRSQAP